MQDSPLAFFLPDADTDRPGLAYLRFHHTPQKSQQSHNQDVMKL